MGALSLIRPPVIVFRVLLDPGRLHLKVLNYTSKDPFSKHGHIHRLRGTIRPTTRTSRAHSVGSGLGGDYYVHGVTFMIS